MGPIQPGQLGSLAWHANADANLATGRIPNAIQIPIGEHATGYQASGATVLSGGEGCWLRGDKVFCSTKGDHRVWQLNVRANTIEIIFDMATSTKPRLENVYAAAKGDVYVAEDTGSLPIVALMPSKQVKPVVHVAGQTNTEITGPALSPGGTRLYFNAQRNPGPTYEVTGLFDGVSKLPFMNQLGGGVLVGALATLAALRMRGK